MECAGKRPICVECGNWEQDLMKGMGQNGELAQQIGVLFLQLKKIGEK